MCSSSNCCKSSWKVPPPMATFQIFDTLAFFSVIPADSSAETNTFSSMILLFKSPATNTIGCSRISVGRLKSVSVGLKLYNPALSLDWLNLMLSTSRLYASFIDALAPNSTFATQTYVSFTRALSAKVSTFPLILTELVRISETLKSLLDWVNSSVVTFLADVDLTKLNLGEEEEHRIALICDSASEHAFCRLMTTIEGRVVEFKREEETGESDREFVLRLWRPTLRCLIEETRILEEDCCTSSAW
mmetsp:Transcript_25727/g.41325  ORF Transcript_25727/g.41325 Transcript_25727/m.41325 type:complete len:246 (-) Transcript_25727:571-1308(-)